MVDPPLTIRTAQPDEFDEVGALTARVYLEEGFTFGSYVPALRDAAGRARNATLLVAPLQQRVAGTVTLVLGGPYAQLSGPDEAEIRMLAVDPSARGRGVGEELIRECLTRAQAAGRIRLLLATQPEMSAAHRLYRRLGFRRLAGRDFSPAPSVDLSPTRSHSADAKWWRGTRQPAHTGQPWRCPDRPGPPSGSWGTQRR